MADYRISLGAELRTSEIDKEVKKYKGNVNVGIDPNSIKSSIDAAINGYRPPKQIELKAHLNTENIRKAIQNYKTDRLKAIKPKTDLDTTGIDTKLAAYETNPRTITVKASLDEQSIASQINTYNQSGKAPAIKVAAELNDNAIGDAIKQYDTSNQSIRINVKPVFDDFDAADAEKLLDGYTARVPLKVNLELNKTHINEQITAYNATAQGDNARTVILKAKLTDTGVADAISNYKTSNADKLKIPIDLTFNSSSEFDTELKQKITAYESVPVEIPVKLKPAEKGFTNQISKLPVYIDAQLKNADDINRALDIYESSPVPVAAKLVPAAKGFASELTKTPIQVQAELAPDALNNAITNPPKNLGKLPINIRLSPKDQNDINSQIKQLAPFITEAIDVGVTLDKKSVNEAIATFEPIVKLEVKPDLALKDVEEQIKAYVPTTPVKVNVLLDNNDIDEKTGKQKEQEAILVDVQLNRENLNEQIRDFKPTSKVKVPVKLDFATHKDESGKEIQKGVAQQLKEYQGKTKLKVGVELDRNSVESAISTFNTNTPVSVGVELTPESVQRVHSQIDDIRQRFDNIGNINVNINSGTSGNASSISNEGQGIQTVRIARGNSDATRAYRELISIVGRLGTAKKDLAKLNLKTIKTQEDVQEIAALTRQIDNLDGKYKELYKTFSNQFDAVQLDTLRIRLETIEEKLSRINSRALEAENSLDKMASVSQNANVADNDGSGGGVGSSASVGVITSESDTISNIAQDFAALTASATNAENVVEAMQKELGDLRVTNADVVTQDIREMGIEVQKVVTSINGDKLKMKVTGIQETEDGIRRIVTLSKEYENAVANPENINKTFTQTFKTREDALKGINNEMSKFVKLQNQIDNMKGEIGKLEAIGGKTNQIEELNRQLEELEATYGRLMGEFMKKISGNADILSMDDIKKFEEELAASAQKAENELNEYKAKLADVRAETAKGIKIKIADDSFDNDISKTTAKFNKLNNKSDETKEVVKQLEAAFKAMKVAAANGTPEELVAAWNNYKEVLASVNNQLDISIRKEQEHATAQKLIDDRTAFQSKVDAWMTKNSAATKQFGARLLELKAQAQSCDRVTLDHLERELKQIDKEAEATGVKMQTFGDRLKSQLQKYSSYFSIASLFMYAGQAMRSMFEQVKLIDSAMTELKKVTNETDESYNRFLTNAAAKAKELGTTVDGLIESTADFARLGYGFEESQELAEVANIYAVVGDEIEGVEDATQSLVSTLAAFKKEAKGISDSEFAMSIVDKMNEVSNNFAISSGGIGEALQRSASSMAAANNTLDETIAMITAANEVAQNPEKVGNAMKTMSMRIRGAKTELEEAGESTDGMAESTASLRAEIKALSGVDIMLNENEFKATYQIMDELSQKWEDLSDIAQATIIELVAGKHQGNVFSSLMSNFDVAREALDTSLNSSGSAMAEHAKWSESLEARLNKLKAAWQSLSQSFLESSFLKGALDVVIKLADGVSALIDTLGMLPTAALAFAAFKSLSGGGFFKVIEDEAGLAGKTITNVFSRAAASIKQTFSASFSFGAGFEAALADDVVALDNYIAKLRAGVPAEEAFAQEMREASFEARNFAQTMNTATMSSSQFEKITRQSQITEQAASFRNAKALIVEYNGGLQSCKLTQNEFLGAIGKSNVGLAKYLSGLNGAKGSFVGYIASLVGAKVATFALEAATLALNAAITMGISLIITGLVTAITNWIQKEEKLAEEVEETTSAFKEQHKELQKLKKDYNADDENSMISRYAKLSKGVDNFGRNISLTADEYSEYQNIANKIAEQIPSMIAGYDDQGNAILGVKSNVEELIAAYEKLIKTENNKVLNKSKDITDNFADIVEEANKNSSGGKSKMSYDAAKTWKEILNSSDSKGKAEKWYQNYKNSGGSDYTSYRNDLSAFITAMQANGVAYEDDGWESDEEYLKRVFSEHKDVVNRVIEEFYSDLENKVSGMQSIADAVLSNALDISDSDYYNMSDTMKNVVRKVVNGFDYEFFAKLQKDGKSVEEYIKGLLSGFDKADDTVATSIETAFDLQTKFNGGKVTYGEYAKGIKDAKSKIDSLEGIDNEIKQDIKLSLDDDEIDTQYNHLFNHIKTQYEDKIKNLGYDMNPSDISDIEDEIEGILSDFTITEIAAAIDIESEIDWNGSSLEDIQKQIEEQAKLIEAMNFDLDIEVETAGIESLNTALSESKSATGLATESIGALKDRYKDLEGYDAAALFEETANGIRINSTELAKLEEEYKDLNEQEIDETLKTLKKEYDKLTGEINNCTDDQEKLNKLYSERDAILDQINDVATLAAQFKGLTSAYNEWQNAQEAGQDRDMYESILSGKEDIENEMSRGWLDDAAVEYLELLSGKELSTAGIDAQIEAYKNLGNTIKGTNYSVWDFFTEDEDGNATSDGIYNFFEAVKEASDGVAAYLEDGKYNFNFEGFEYEGETGDAAIAKMLGTSEELVQIMLEAAEDAGFVVNIKGEYTDLANASDDIHKLNEQLKTVGATEYTFNVNSTDLKYVNEQITEAKSALQYFENRDGKINLDDSDVRAAATIFAQLVFQKSNLENPILMSLDVSEPTTKLEEVLGLAQQLKNAKANLEVQTEIGADTTEAQAQIDSLLTQISSDKYADITAGLSINTADIDNAIATINAIDVEKIISVDANFDTSKIDGYVPPEKDATVTYSKDSTEVDEYDPPDFTRTVTFTVDSYSVDMYDPSNLTRTVTYKVKTEGEISEVNGTANANGTAFTSGTIGGRAYRHGDWGIKGSGVALGGELGTEILVRDGKWYTIGDNGAEFFGYRQGDIIFNHKQTEELFANGKVTSGGGRGRALAEGTAFAIGSNASGLDRDAISKLVDIADDGGKKAAKPKIEKKSTSVTVNNNDNSTTNNYNNNGSTASGGMTREEMSSAVEEFEETFDWIAIAIERIEREIDNLDRTANSVYRSWSDRNSALAEEITKVSEEIQLQNDAADEYLREANKVGLSDYWKERVQIGAIDIDDLNQDNSKKDLVEKIKNYQKWYELYLQCTDKAEELKETEAGLWSDRFSNVQSKYDGILQGFEHTESMLDEYISQAEARGRIVSKQYYHALKTNKEAELKKLEEEKSELLAKREEYYNAMVKQGMTGEQITTSEEWYNMSADIDSVTQSIEEGNTALIEYANSIRDIGFEVFELAQKRISDVAAEADFLIELMSNKDLFDDNGKLTDQGLATMALHGQNYNTYMYQADDYGAKAQEIKDRMALSPSDEKYLDPIDQNNIDKYNEYIELQRESILAAEDEKNAIKDLVEEGINLELDALQERIDKKNEELESEKDLYEYQKKVKEQTKEIASLQKQLSSYEGFDDEETKAKVQQLKVELEEAETNLKETEWDRYIDQQAQILDTLYNEYELILNTRLDNIDLLLGNIKDNINSNADTISQTLRDEVGDVGTKLSEAMSNIWVGEGAGKAVIDLYGGDFQSKLTTTNLALGSIKANVDAMVDDVDKEAKQKVNAPQTQPSSVDVPTGGNTGGNTDIVPDGGSGGDGIPKVGDAVTFKSGKYYYSSDGLNPSGSSMLGKTVYITKISNASWSKKPYHIARDKEGKKPLGWLSLDQLSGYATGKKNFLDDEIAWTQEGGKQEYIVRPSDGAILTPIARKGSVLNAQASENLWSMTNSPAEFIKDNLNLGSTSVPNNSNAQSNYTQHLDKVVFNLPNVKNYDELLSAMQKDKNFERLILSMSIDRIAGKSSLAKGKSIR